MNKQELISRTSEIAGVSKKDTTPIVEAVFEAIAEALNAGDPVKLKGHGNYTVKETAARVGRNPQTNLPIDIEAGVKVKFKPSDSLLKQVN